MVMRLIDGKIEGLVINCHKKSGRPKMKWPGGGNEEGEKPFLDIMKTVRREAREELGVEINLDDQTLAGRCIFIHELGFHKRFFFLISEDEISGELRVVEKDDGDEILSIPFWVEATYLCEIVFPSHKIAFLMGLHLICRWYRPAMENYYQILFEEKTIHSITNCT